MTPRFDLDGDAAMNIVDIQHVAGHWNMDVSSHWQYDLNCNDAINVLDIVLVADEWGAGCQ